MDWEGVDDAGVSQPPYVAESPSEGFRGESKSPILDIVVGVDSKQHHQPGVAPLLQAPSIDKVNCRPERTWALCSTPAGSCPLF